MRHSFRFFLLVIPLFFLSACTGDDDSSPTSDLRGQASDFNLDGTWDGESSNGLTFVMRLTQQGSSVGGDIAVDGLKVPLVGGMEDNVFYFEADLRPTTFGEAEVNEASTAMLNGALAVQGQSLGSWTATKRR